MKHTLAALVVLAAILPAGAAMTGSPKLWAVMHAQAPPLPPRSASTVIGQVPSLVVDATPTPGTLLTVRWLATGTPPGDALLPLDEVTPRSSRFEVLSRRAVQFEPVVERDPQLSEDDIVVVALDDGGQELGWARLKDPRVVRAEQPAADGTLSGRTLYRADAEIEVWLPGRTDLAALRVYKPQWNGREFDLTGLGTIPLR